MTAPSSSSPGFIDPPGNQASRLRRWATRRRIRRRTRALSRRFRLREALGELIHDIGHDDMPPRFHSDVVDVALPVPIALLCYHVAREGVMNASMHGKPQDVWVTVAQIEGEIVLRVRDNG